MKKITKKLSLVGLAALIIGTGVVVRSSLNEQDLRGRASSTEITFVNASSANTGPTANATSVTIPTPAGIKSGDIIVALLQADYGHIGGTIPAGWVLISERNEADDLAAHAYYKIVGSSEPANYTWTIINTDPTAKAQKHEALAGGTLLAFRGVDTTNPVFASVINPETADPTTVECPSVNAPAGGMLVCEFTDDDPAPDTKVPATMTRVSNFIIRSNDSHAAAYEKIANAGQTGSRIASINVPASQVGKSNNDIGIGIVLRPATSSSSPYASGRADSNTLPSFGVIAPCNGCQSDAISPVVSGGANGTGMPVKTNPVVSAAPCSVQNASVASGSDTTIASKHKNKHKSHKGGISDGMTFLLKFFMQLLNLLLQLLGGNPITPVPQPCATNPQVSLMPQPSSVASSPDPSAVPSVAVVPSGGTGDTKLVLNNWKLQLPTGAQGKVTEVTQPQLASFTLDPWYLPSGTGGIRFRAAVNGVTTSGSKYPRSELREMNNGAGASWSSATGTRSMTIDEAITAVPKTRKQIVAGQIHDGTSDVVFIRLDFPKLFIKAGQTVGPTLDANYTLGKRFTVKFEVNNGQTAIYYNGSTTPVYTMNTSYTNAYFKAGAYTQSNCSTEGAAGCTADNFGEVVIYKLDLGQ